MTKKLIGKLIRKKTISGKPIGPYLVVLMSNRWQSYAVCLEGKPKAIFLKKKNIYQVKELNLPLELKTFKRVQSGAQTKIQHSVTTTYDKLFTKSLKYSDSLLLMAITLISNVKSLRKSAISKPVDFISR